jgi:hypothetical protein
VAFDTGMLTVNGGLPIHVARSLADATETDPLARQHYGRPPLREVILLPEGAQAPGARTLTGTARGSSSVDRFCDAGTVWDRIQRSHEHHGDVPLEVRILKLTEEVGEVAEAFIGMRGLNSRKGVCRSREDLLDELADVVITAAVA